MTTSIEQLKADGWLKEANYIAGEWVGADDGKTYAVENPATETRIGDIPWVGAAETRRAIDAAQSAFVSWSRTTAPERAALLHQMAQIVYDNLDTFAAMLTFEQGKPLAEARAEMKLGADYIQWFAEEARRINGEIVPSPWKDRQILVTREPVGVVGAISPWNFPFSMLSRKVAPALAAGCTIVIKPSEFTPFCGLLYGILAEKAGVPAGVVNVVTGDGAAVGGELTSNSKVRKITFTGFTRVGKLLYKQSVTVERYGFTGYESGKVLAQRLLTRTERPDAVFCATDLLACGFMDAARHQFSISVPDQLSIVGFDDIEQASWSSYDLTTFAQPVAAIASEAVRWLSAEPSGDEEHSSTRLHAELVWRGSVRAG